MTDKRTVHTDALETLGNIITEDEARDAIHLAVEPIMAVTNLRPGEDVGLVEGGAGKSDNPIGIVDPFLKNTVKRGEWFWLLIYPRQITSLRHVWAHPAFEDKEEQLSPVDIDRELLEGFASEIGIHFEDLMEAARDYLEYDTYKHMGDNERYSNVDMDEFWKVYCRYTGTTTIPEYKSFFTCSC